MRRTVPILFTKKTSAGQFHPETGIDCLTLAFYFYIFIDLPGSSHCLFCPGAVTAYSVAVSAEVSAGCSAVVSVCAASCVGSGVGASVGCVSVVCVSAGCSAV